MFVVPAKTFDNVTGSFPIGFKIWDSNNEKNLENIESDVYDGDEEDKFTSINSSYKFLIDMQK